MSTMCVCVCVRCTHCARKQKSEVFEVGGGTIYENYQTFRFIPPENSPWTCCGAIPSLTIIIITSLNTVPTHQQCCCCCCCCSSAVNVYVYHSFPSTSARRNAILLLHLKPPCCSYCTYILPGRFNRVPEDSQYDVCTPRAPVVRREFNNNLHGVRSRANPFGRTTRRAGPHVRSPPFLPAIFARIVIIVVVKVSQIVLLFVHAFGRGLLHRVRDTPAIRIIIIILLSSAVGNNTVGERAVFADY